MRSWPRAAAAAAAFIFKLLSGQRARRGRGPRPAANLILGRPAAARPPSGLAPAWLPAYLRVRPARAPHAGRSPWLRRHWRFFGGSQRQRRRRRPEARTGVPRRIPPGPPGGQRLEAAALGVGEVEAGGQRNDELPATRCRSSAIAILLLCPAPAQSWSRPNPIVQPGLGLASPHVPSARGGDGHPRRDGVRSHRGHNSRAPTPPCSAARGSSLRSFCSRRRADAERGHRCRLG